MQHRRGGGRDRRSHGDRPERSRDERGGFARDERGAFSRDERGGFGAREDRGYGRRDDRGGFGSQGFGAPRRDRFPQRSDEGAMSLRLDPRRLGSLKQLAAEEGVRPGELVTRWVEERIDAERGGGRAAPPVAPDLVADLGARLDELTRRVDELVAAIPGGGQEPATQAEPAEQEPAPVVAPTPAEPARRRGRRPRGEANGNGRGPKIALHDEIIAVISERGPMSAADLASAITERGRYTAPRSGKPLDAATVSARVSNPVYRSRFRRENGRIALAE